MGKLFGTDGVRGLANRELTAELALQLGEAAARVLTRETRGGGRPKAVVGRDTRASGELLADAVAAGLASAGVDVQHVGVLPTPGIAYLTQAQDVDLGVVISASHNPMPDNGIKFFARGGYKLDDALEAEIEGLLGKEWNRPIGASVGRIEYDAENAAETYIRHLTHSVHTSLKGLTVAMDCANGATSDVAPEAFRRAGAQVRVISAAPDGYNINEDCGSTHIEHLQKFVVDEGCDFGVAFDGDADRCLAVDGEGNVVDGDQIMGMLALAMKGRGTLAKDTLVLTVMSNLGLKLAMADAGIEVAETGVGDRYVLEEMRAHGYNLGGEQSGHVINLRYATTGDGTLTGLKIAAEVARAGKPLAEMVSVIKRLPQTLINVSGVDKYGSKTNEAVLEAVREAEEKLGKTGRVLLRPSGTEPLVRVMVEAATQEEADAVCRDLANVVRVHLSLN
ncbi:MAG: phosphoglucosamine mutase [Actinomycetaceae bacterium]|nr:phosphoglucosamine mutase [Actinomycetaceae bacterium]